MTDINEFAERLKSAIRDNKLGFDREMLHFIQRYALSPEIKKKAILNIYKLVKNNADTLVKNETIELINTIVDNYSPEQFQQQVALLSMQERLLGNEYEKRREDAFSCTGLLKSFGKDFSLGKIDIKIRKGEITGVVGENGNGKTTFFRIVAGDLTYDEGEIKYPFLKQSSSDNRNIDWALVKSRIAFVPQELPNLFGDLRHHLQYEAAIHGIRGKDNLLQVEYIIQRLGLQNHIHKKWKALSGGFKLRFALAKALVWQPDMMILDEPLANLDVNAQLSILRDIKHLATSVSNPIAVFISSQHLHEVEAIADNLIFLQNGKALFNDAIENLGRDRINNIFEVGISINYPQFMALFPKNMEVSIRHDGLHYIVVTPASFSKIDLLNIFITNDLDLCYFRDISRSSKKYFMQAA